jgi:hypothetical protein
MSNGTSVAPTVWFDDRSIFEVNKIEGWEELYERPAAATARRWRARRGEGPLVSGASREEVLARLARLEVRHAQPELARVEVSADRPERVQVGFGHRVRCWGPQPHVGDLLRELAERRAIAPAVVVCEGQAIVVERHYDFLALARLLEQSGLTAA